jgi:hypothetical protein
MGGGEAAFKVWVRETGDGQLSGGIGVANPFRTADWTGDSERDKIAA